MKEYLFFKNISADEDKMLREAICLSIPKLGIKKSLFGKNEMPTYKMIEMLSKELFGVPYSYNVILDFMLKGYKINPSKKQSINEDLLIKKIIDVFIRSLSETERGKFAKEYKFINTNNINEFVNNVLNRYNVSNNFRTWMPLFMTASTLKSATFLFSTSTVLLLSPLLAGVFTALSLFAGTVNNLLFNTQTTKSGKNILASDLNVIFLVLYIIRRNHKVILKSAKECIQYLSAVIKENQQFQSEEKATVAVLSSIVLFNDRSETVRKIKERFETFLRFDRDKLLPLYICRMISGMNGGEKDIVINYLMERLFSSDKIEIENFQHSNEILVDKKVGYLYYKFPYTRISNKCFYFPKERCDDDEHLTLSEYLYVYYKGINPFEYIRLPQKEEDYILLFNEEQAENSYNMSEENAFPKTTYNLSKKIKSEDAKKNLDSLLSLSMEDLGELKKLFDNKTTFEGKFIQYIYDLRIENQNLKSRLSSISQMVHRVNHEISPEFGVVRSLVEENKERIGEKLSRIKDAFSNIVDFVDNYDDNDIGYKNIAEIIQTITEERKYDDCVLEFNFISKTQLTVLIDSEFVPTVLDNIINNARNHGFKRSDKKYIIRFLLEQSEHEIKLVISNNGDPYYGNPDKIFDFKYKFGPHGNTGEGLFLAKKYMNKIGGDIKFVSSSSSEFPIAFELTFRNKIV